MFRLNERSKKAIQRKLGLDAEAISKMKVEDIDERIEKKIGKKLKTIPEYDIRLAGRGSVYLFLLRLLGIKTIDKQLAKI